MKTNLSAKIKIDNLKEIENIVQSISIGLDEIIEKMIRLAGLIKTQ